MENGKTENMVEGVSEGKTGVATLSAFSFSEKLTELKLYIIIYC